MCKYNTESFGKSLHEAKLIWALYILQHATPIVVRVKWLYLYIKSKTRAVQCFFFLILSLSESHDILDWIINNTLNHKRPQILTV